MSYFREKATKPKPSSKFPTSKPQSLDIFHIKNKINENNLESFTHKTYKKYIMEMINELMGSTKLTFSEVFQTAILENFDLKEIKNKLRIKRIEKENCLKENKDQLKIATNCDNLICLICEEKIEQLHSIECGHTFCENCLKTYVQTILESKGVDAVTKTCPMAGCKILITEKLVEGLFGWNAKITRIFRRTFDNFIITAKNKDFIKCSNEDCKYLIKLSSDIKPNSPIKCPALHQTCSKCYMANHNPFPCSLVSTFLENSNALMKNSMWMIANSKKCVQCGKYIEKNGGCNHMTCKLCGKEFCWLCLSNWKGHDSSICGKLQQEVERKQKEMKEYATKMIENFRKIDMKYPNFEKTIDYYMYNLNLFENAIQNNGELKVYVGKVLGFIEFLREAWISVYFGLNLIFLKRKIKKAEKIEKICSKINDDLLPVMDFFKNVDGSCLKFLLQYLKEEKNMRNLSELKEDLSSLQNCYIEIKIKKKIKFVLN